MKILLVEDSGLIAAVLIDRLESLGHAVAHAENGSEGIRLYQQDSYDLILMDIEMPVINGFEATTHIRQLEALQVWSWTPIIFLTASDTPENMVMSIDAGGDDFMIKSVPDNVLFAKMKALARISAMRHRLASAHNELNLAYTEAQSARAEAENAHALAKQALEDLRAAQAQLIQAEKMASLGLLVGNVAHEINTPIGAIKSSASLITDILGNCLASLPKLLTLLDPTLQRLFTQLITHKHNFSQHINSRDERNLTKSVTAQLEKLEVVDASRKARLVIKFLAHENVLDYLPLFKHPSSDFIVEVATDIADIVNSSSNINTAIEKVSRIVYALKALSGDDILSTFTASSLVTDMEKAIEKYKGQMQDVELVRLFQNDLEPIMADHEALQQVCIHVLMNALQSMNYSGKLVLSLSCKDKQALISVADTGCGISENIKGKIFDPFFTTRTSGEGSGMGLAIVKNVVDKHQGRIELQSEIGKGSTFSVFLPIQRE